MAEFGDNFEQDPAAEFLQREQNALAGLEDEIPPVNTQPNGKSRLTPFDNIIFIIIFTLIDKI